MKTPVTELSVLLMYAEVAVAVVLARVAKKMPQWARELLVNKDVFPFFPLPFPLHLLNMALALETAEEWPLSLAVLAA